MVVVIMTRLIITIALALIHFKSMGQFHRKDNEGLFILSPGLFYQEQLFCELNLMYAKNITAHGIVLIWGPRIGTEINFKADRFIYAPKIGYEISGFPLALRANTVAYVDRSQIDIRLLPEIGLSFFGLINLTYGYNFPVSGFKSSEISRQRISLIANLDFDLWNKL